MDIQGNVFIVTGGASGLGAGTARMLAEAGGKVVIADLNEAAGTALAQELGGAFVKCDVASEADGQAVVAAALALGRVSGLVNCAGIATANKTVGKNGPHPLDAFDKTIRINLVGTFNMIRLAAAAMVQNTPDAEGERGVIINTASVAAFDGQIGQAAYAASKGGVVAMTLAIARDLSRDGVRCVTIAPGLFETPMLLGMPQDVQDALGKWCRSRRGWAAPPSTPSWPRPSSATPCSTGKSSALMARSGCSPSKPPLCLLPWPQAGSSITTIKPGAAAGHSVSCSNCSTPSAGWWKRRRPPSRSSTSCDSQAARKAGLSAINPSISERIGASSAWRMLCARNSATSLPARCGQSSTRLWRGADRNIARSRLRSWLSPSSQPTNKRAASSFHASAFHWRSSR